MKKRLLSLIFAAMMALSLTACGNDVPPQDSTGNTDKVEQTPPDLKGEWEQTNKNSEDSYQTATITDDTITVNWVMPDSKALYWAGSFEAPTTADEPYTWESKNDTEQTSTAILASPDETKSFTYENGVISYEVSAMGVTTTVKLEKK